MVKPSSHVWSGEICGNMLTSLYTSAVSVLKQAIYEILSQTSPYLYTICRLVCGTLYPAYASYKAIRTKNVKEYVKWMMYWIVFAIFLSVETFSDVLLSWLPFYYEIKMVFVIWMLSPITKGSSYLYKKFVHPHLVKREKEIDEYISQATKQGYSTLMNLGQRGLTYATNVVVKTAIKGQSTLVEHVRKSYSTNDLRVPDDSQNAAGNLMDSDEEFEERLSQDNREIERRKEKRKLHRSTSDVTDSRSVRPQKASGLSKLEEEEEEEQISYTEEVYYTESYYSPKDHKNDPYGTLPRTRARTRAKLHQ
ncbi:receptor expression-enhancing protein 2-like isoform X2 [Ylistrum balloti]|uniref:receptor expression-enhancing protein 2-like isoform X2 n=1 Tax=Ylistrum balloti TaxID=509963 RepID=UPI002905AFF7|nr:receptor expression-enhancing protein 2-like isoform X2 [Ylistrum balloti]